MKIALAGASGFVGLPLVEELHRAGHRLVVLTRRPAATAPALPLGAAAVAWDGRAVGDWAAELAGADAVVNLAGASIGGGRWTERRKRELLASRVDSTSALVAAIARLAPAERPAVLVNASGIDYAGDRGGELVGEDVSPGDSFLARVCVEWEAAAWQACALGLRVVVVRTPLVLGRGALALRLMALPFRLGLGGTLGNGRQWLSWVHLDDVVGLYRLALDTSARGVLNAVAPDPRPQREVAREVARVLRRPSWLPAPAPLLRLALGEQADLLLHGQRAMPGQALELGYAFRRPELGDALAEALG